MFMNPEFSDGKSNDVINGLLCEINRLSGICRTQEEVISKLAEIAKEMADELAQHRAVDNENRMLDELRDGGWI